METGFTPQTAVRGKNHNGRAHIAKEWQLRLEATKRKVHAAIAAMQKEFADVAEPSARRPLNGEQADVLAITPEAVVSRLTALEWRESSEGDVDRDLAAVDPKTGDVWSVHLGKSGEVTIQMVRPRVTPPDINRIQYAPGHEQFVQGNGNGQEAWKKEPATLTIAGRGQELVFKTPA